MEKDPVCNMGNIKISDEVVATIANVAAGEIEGVITSGSKSSIDIKGIITKKNVSKGVKVDMTDGKVLIDVYCIIKYGYKISETATAVQENVLRSVSDYTGLEVTKVNVHITGILFPKDMKEDKEK